MLVPILVLQVVTAAPPPPAPASDPPAPYYQNTPYPPYYGPPAPPAYPAASYVPPPATMPKPPSTWFARVSLGAGFLFSTDQTRLLQQEGYDLRSRFWLQADGAWLPSQHVGIGGFAVWGGMSSQPKQGGPSLSDDIYMLGAQVPFVFGTDLLWGVLSPRAGLGWGYLGFSSSAKAMVAPTFGAEASLLFRKLHFGFTTGVMSAPTSSAGELGRHYDMGGYYVLLTGVIDG